MYRVKFVFPSKQLQQSADTLVLWAYNTQISACSALLDGTLDPLSFNPINQYRLEYRGDKEPIITLNFSPTNAVLFGKALQHGETLLHSCIQVDAKAYEDLLIIMELRPYCSTNTIEIACNHVDDDCDGLTDECVSDQDCQQDNPCLSAVCSSGVCECRALDGKACDDGLFCTVDEYCQAGQCSNGSWRDCSDMDGVCVEGICDEETDRCIGNPSPEGLPCDDEIFCTIEDKCDGQGACVGLPRPCKQMDSSCSKGRCDEESASCVAEPTNEGKTCDDDEICSQPDTCQNGVCTGPKKDDDGDGVCNPLDLCTGNDGTGDTDNDGDCNDTDIDDDGDGWPDTQEILCETDPLVSVSSPLDSDTDGICDALDLCNGNDHTGDTDNDGDCNDTDNDDDNDGWSDADEISCNSDSQELSSKPLDSDNDGICNFLDQCTGDDQTGDTDGDGSCDDNDTDDDNDGWSDVAETKCGTDPLSSSSTPGDTDGDGVCNFLDLCVGSDTSGDLDGDGSCNDIDSDDDDDYWSDESELACGTDPLLSSSLPNDSDGDGTCDQLDLCWGADNSGDSDGNGLCDDIDPVWLSKAPMPYAAGGLASALLSDGLHILGGASRRDATECFQEHYLYSAQNDVWLSDPAPIPDTDTCAAQAQVYHDRLYLAGGWPDGKRFRVYDPAFDSWENLPNIPNKFEYGFVTAIVGDYLYIIGGFPAPKAKAYAYGFDMVSQSWSAIANLPKNNGNGSLAGASAGSKIYIINGDKAGGKTILQIYDTQNDKWLKGAKLANHAEAAAAIGFDNKIYYFGGASDHDIGAGIEIINTMNIYDIHSNTWSIGLDMPSGLTFSSVQILDGEFHVLGGFDTDGNARSHHQVYAQ